MSTLSSNAVHAVVDIAARATSTSTSTSTENRPPVYKVIGLSLAICSGLFIGVSFVIKKIGLLQANKKYNEAAGEGYGYLKNWCWWLGMTLMIVGEICNFVAYAFVDAILVTPMGAISVVVTAILSAIFLKERLSFVGKLGCFNCIVGSVVIVLNAPDESTVATIQEMQHYVIAPGFLAYAGVILAASLFTALWAGPRYGKKSMLIYLSVCSWVGGLSVVATQGLGAAIVTQIGGTAQFNQWFLYVLLVFVVCTLLTEIVYLNKALNLFNAALVTPTYYVYFTSTTMITSAVLFRGFKGSAISITTLILGFLQICTGVILLQLSKSSKDVPDTAVFKGDLDQIRTIAEQEEPEYEPRADTIRGGGAILRAVSSSRTRREFSEVKSINENMGPIAENETVEWDGLRRRKTVISNPNSQNTGSLRRAPTLHPPLGMSRFPDEDESIAESDDVHPGFFPRFGRRSTRRSGRRNTSPSPVAMSGLRVTNPESPSKQQAAEHIFGLPPGLRKAPFDGGDTAYHGSEHIRWDHAVDQSPTRVASPGGGGVGPAPPAHKSRTFSFQRKDGGRTFSFQKGSSRSNSPVPTTTTTTTPQPGAPTTPTKARAPPALNMLMHKKQRKPESEEERLGLVKGDSRSNLTYDSSPAASPDRPLMQERHLQAESGLRNAASAAPRESDDWGLASPVGGYGLDGAGERPRRGYQRGRYVDSDEEYDGLGPVQRAPGGI